MRRNPLFKKLKGYHRIPRERFQLLLKKELTQEEFLLYELGISATVWDRKKDDYGLFKATNAQLSEVLGWKDDSTASRYRKSLVEKGWFIKKEDGYTQVKGVEQYISRKEEFAEMQDSIAETQAYSAETQPQVAELQTNQPQSNDYPLVSYKGNLGSSIASNYESLSDEELDKIDKAIEDKKSDVSSKKLSQMSEEELEETMTRIFGEEVKTEDKA